MAKTKLDLSDKSAWSKKGLHQLKDHFDSKTHMEACCNFVTEHFDAIHSVTKEESPQRTQSTVFGRGFATKIDSSQRERIWELAISLRWGNNPCEVEGAWWKILDYQVPIFDQQKKNGWGYIDLLGCTDKFEPCVIELKREPGTTKKGGTKSTETPLRMILEAAAYAVAIRKHWDFYRQYWQQSPQKPEPENFHLVAAAPAGFWLEWSPWTARGRNKLPESCWLALKELCCRLTENGYPVHFVSLSGAPEVPDTLAVQPLQLFEPCVKKP